MKRRGLPKWASPGGGTHLLPGFACVAWGVVLLHRQWPASPLWNAGACAAIALAIWHGAYDEVLARRWLEPGWRDGWRGPFYLGYLGTAALVLGLWYAFPAAMLVLFLLYSALHFGMEGTHERTALPLVSATAEGMVPLAAACRWGAGEVVPIFTCMLRGRPDLAAYVTSVCGHLLFPAVALALCGVLGSGQALVKRGVWIALALMLFYSCPPVLGFAVFFCAWHTPEHLLETSRNEEGAFSLAAARRNLRAGLVPWLLALVVVGAVAWMGRHAMQAYLGVLFIALSALTVPHMVLAVRLETVSHRGGLLPGARAIGRPAR